MQYRKKNTQGSTDEPSSRGSRRDDRGGRKSFRRGGGPSQGHSGAQYKPKQESAPMQYQRKGTAGAGEQESSEKGGNQRYEPKSKRSTDRATDNQPKYRIKRGGQPGYLDEREDEDQVDRFRDRDQIDHRDDQDDNDRDHQQNESQSRQIEDMPQTLNDVPSGENPSNSQNSYQHVNAKVLEGSHGQMHHNMDDQIRDQVQQIDEQRDHQITNQPRDQMIQQEQFPQQQFERYNNPHVVDPRGPMGPGGNQDGQHFMGGQHDEQYGRYQNQNFYQGQQQPYYNPGPPHGQPQMPNYGDRFNKRDQFNQQMDQPYHGDGGYYPPQRGQHPNEMYHQNDSAGYSQQSYHTDHGSFQYGPPGHQDQQWPVQQDQFERFDQFQGNYPGGHQQFGPPNMGQYQRGYDNFYHGGGGYHQDRYNPMGRGQMQEYHPPSQGYGQNMNDGSPPFMGHPGQNFGPDNFAQPIQNSGGFSAEARPFQPRRDAPFIDEGFAQEEDKLAKATMNEKQGDDGQQHDQKVNQFSHDREQEGTPSRGMDEPVSHQRRGASHEDELADMRHRSNDDNTDNQPSSKPSQTQSKWQPKGTSKKQQEQTPKYQAKQYRPKDRDRDREDEYGSESDDRQHSRGPPDNRPRQSDYRNDHHQMDDPRDYGRRGGRGRRGGTFDERFEDPWSSRRGGYRNEPFRNEPYHIERRSRGDFRGKPRYEEYRGRGGPPPSRGQYRDDRRRGRDEDYDYDYSRDYDYMDRRGGADYDNYLDRDDYYDEYGREDEEDRYRREYERQEWDRGMERQRGGRQSFADKRRGPERETPRGRGRGRGRGTGHEDYYYDEDDRSYEYDDRDRERYSYDARRGPPNQQRERPSIGRSESYSYSDDGQYYDEDPYYDEEEDEKRDQKRRTKDRFSERDTQADRRDPKSRKHANSQRDFGNSNERGRPNRRGSKVEKFDKGERPRYERKDDRQSDDGQDEGRRERRRRGGRKERERQEKKLARGRGAAGSSRQGNQREEIASSKNQAYREKTGNQRQGTQGAKKEGHRRASADRARSSEQREKRGKMEYRKKGQSFVDENDKSADDKGDDRDSMGEIDEQKVDDFADDEFKWDDNDFEEDEPEFLAAESSQDQADESGVRSSTASSSTASGAHGGNNQVSRRFYQMGPQTDQVKAPCTVMMVAEKPSIALSITEALCGKDFSKRTGPAKGIPIFTFKGHFKGRAANFKVTSVAGHVYNRDFPLEYQNRNKDPAVLFDAPTIKSCDRRARPVAKQLQMVAKNLDFMVLWLDCDKEGENICFEVLDICKKSIPKSSGRVQRVFRAKFSSIAKKDIVNAFEGLKHEPNYNEAISVDARQVLDLKIGVAFSRFQTSRLASSIRKAGIRMLTYGPCQTPTLGFCVDQAEKIKKFVPETFWRVEAQMVDTNGRTHNMKWCRGKIFDKTTVQVIHERIERHYGAKEAEVLSVKRNNVKQVRPQGLNTVKLLKVGSQSYGLSAHETMRIAEHLYLSGYTTYPRTESTTFSSNFNFKEVLSALKEHEDYGSYASTLMKKGFNKPRKGVDAGDHPPITPVKAARRGQLRDRELKIYEYITANFLACISEDATYEALRSELLVGDEKFKLKGQILKEEGFLEVMPWQRHSDLEVPQYEVGDIIDIISTRVTETRTEPPGYLTEAELIEKMEKHAIGTDASIPTHIANIIERNYVTVQDPGRKLVPTALGHALVKGYCEIDPELVLPQVRSNIEKSCELIAKGKADFQKVMGHVLHIFMNKFTFFRLNVGTMERILNIMLNVGDANNSSCLSSMIRVKDESKDSFINFCIKCFKGHFCLQYHQKKGWGLKCDSCNFAIRVCQGAARVRRDTETKCQECGSFSVDVYYKEGSPFPGGEPSHTGCLLCDTWLRSLVKNPLKTQQPKLMTAAEAEEAQRQKEARKKLKEEKKAQRDKVAETASGPGAAQGSTAGGAGQASAAAAKKKAKSKANKGAKAVGELLTAEERMNEFMSKFK